MLYSMRLPVILLASAALLSAQVVVGPRGRVRAVRVDNSGEVKIKCEEKDAEIHVDGALSGTVDKLKKFDLRPGKHSVVIRSKDGRKAAHRISVLKGKTIELGCDFK